MRSSQLIITLVALLFVAVYPTVAAKVGPSVSSTSNLNALALLNSAEGWAVGDSGTILLLEGNSWSLIPSGTSLDLFGVSFGPPNAPNSEAGFAVGGSGGTATAVFHGTGGWFSVTTGLSSPGAQKLASVSVLGPTDAWAVDSVSGGIWHWSGTAGLGGGWGMISSAVAGLNSIFMTSESDGWAVGVGGIIYHYAGGGWTLFSTVGTTLNSIFMLSTTEGWAVGNGGATFHYLSGTWTGPVSPAGTSQDLKSVFMVSQTEGWAVGAMGATLHYQGGTWTALAPNQLATNQNLNAVSFSGGTGWAVGDFGTIVQYGGPPTQGLPTAGLQSVYLSNQNDGWMVGCSSGGCGTGAGEPTVAHWNGGSSTRGTVSAPTSDLYSVFMVNPSEGWAVGGVGATPLIVHYTGGTWTQVPVPSNGFVLRSVYMVDSGNGWAVGDNGVILRYSGGAWGQASSPTMNALRSVFMLGATDGWAVGDAGTLLRYEGMNGQWVTISGPTSASLNSVFLSNSNQGWAVGAGGAILHYDGTIWTSVAGFTSTNLNSVFQLTPQQALAVGDSATILQWTGFSWLPVTPSPSIAGTPDLKSVFLVSPGFGLIVGGSPGAGSQATIIPVGQQTTNPIPELHGEQVFLVVVLMTTLAIISRLRRKAPYKISNVRMSAELVI